MNFFYFLDRYFDKLNETKFQIKWKKYFQDNLRRTIWAIFFVWILIVVGVGALLTQALGTFFGILLTIFFGGYFAYVVGFQFIAFLARNNSRFIQSGIFSKENTVKYDDVVETIKKK